jgi:hypothetical protein
MRLRTVRYLEMPREYGLRELIDANIPTKSDRYYWRNPALGN